MSKGKITRGNAGQFFVAGELCWVLAGIPTPTNTAAFVDYAIPAWEMAHHMPRGC